MCEICGQTPCLNRCPNAKEPMLIGTCKQCGQELREDYSYYIDDEGNKFCDNDCADKFHGIKEIW